MRIVENNIDELVVTGDDVIPAGYCIPGARRFAARHNLDFRDFIKNGISAKRLLALNDAMVYKLIEQAERRTRGDKIG